MKSKRILSTVDKRILESLNAKYESADLISAIGSLITPMHNLNVPTANNTEEVTCQETVLDYIKQLEGHVIRMLEIHWSTPKYRVHNTTDEVISEMREVIDSIAENTQGLLGIRLKVGMVSPIIPDYDNATDGYTKILNDTLNFRCSVENIKGMEGVVCDLDDLIKLVNKSKYLTTFD